MDNIRSTIELLFHRQNAGSVILSHYSNSPLKYIEKVDLNWFQDAFEQDFHRYTRDEIKHIHGILSSKWMRRVYPDGSLGSSCNIFHVLLHFVDKVLLEEDDEPRCEYGQLLRWRVLSEALGEDLFTTSYLACKDLLANRNRNYFSWRPTIETNNRQLKEILKKGTTDLHFHLNGSSLNFDLNWLSLMNFISDWSAEFHELNSSKMPDIVFRFDDTLLGLHDLCIKAALIRVILFLKLKESKFKIGQNLINQILICRSEKQILSYTHLLQANIEQVKHLYGRKYGKEIVDYAIPMQLTERDLTAKYHLADTILYGERYLMYHLFKKVYTYDKDFLVYTDLFYAYLLIKERLRREIIQINKRIGFANFSDYQSRKNLFIRKGSIYEVLLCNIAINSTLTDQNIKYLEARITPAESKTGILNRITKLDAQVDDARFLVHYKKQSCLICPWKQGYCVYKQELKAERERGEFYYIFHFIKGETPREMNPTEEELLVNSRNWILRKKVRKQALAINEVRKSVHPLKKRIVGIDAASSEIGFRPEIFAQAYRFLKTYSHQAPYEFIVLPSFQPLGFTYHAGEDFLDLADGLRAIDETILFLNFTRGDRIGHAIALGLDPQKYYTLKNKTLVMPKQDFLDNLAWVLEKIRIYNISVSSQLVYCLTEAFHKYYYDIYDNCVDEAVTPDLYYKSWLLRGDNPEVYKNQGKNSEFKMVHTDFWEYCNINNFSEEVKIARQNRLARYLYKLYHYEPGVKTRGKVYDEFIVNGDYIRLIEMLQKEMRFDIARRHIGIEVNPTSNQLIGSYKRYADHPVIRFFNMGLTHDRTELTGCPQLPVSINTDDQGVFSTCLENEYALMAIAMEKERKADESLQYNQRMIYDWLDRIREMGFEQKFHKD